MAETFHLLKSYLWTPPWPLPCKITSYRYNSVNWVDFLVTCYMPRVRVEQYLLYYSTLPTFAFMDRARNKPRFSLTE